MFTYIKDKEEIQNEMNETEHSRQVSGSSDPSSQSGCPSHFQLFGIHPPCVQLNSSTKHVFSPLVAKIIIHSLV